MLWRKTKAYLFTDAHGRQRANHLLLSQGGGGEQDRLKNLVGKV
jgi:hypothetical protein